MPWTINYTIQDADNHKSRLSTNWNDSLTVAQVQELNLSLQALLVPLIDGGIVGAGAVLNLPVVAGNEVVAAGSDVEVGAKFIFTVAGGYYTSFRVPTFNQSYVIDGGGAIDTTALNEVDDLVQAYTAGVSVTGGTALGQDYRGADVTGLSSALESHQRQRR